jgi:hypothetical protein
MQWQGAAKYAMAVGNATVTGSWQCNIQWYAAAEQYSALQQPMADGSGDMEVITSDDRCGD